MMINSTRSKRYSLIIEYLMMTGRWSFFLYRFMLSLSAWYAMILCARKAKAVSFRMAIFFKTSLDWKRDSQRLPCAWQNCLHKQWRWSGGKLNEDFLLLMINAIRMTIYLKSKLEHCHRKLRHLLRDTDIQWAS